MDEDMNFDEYDHDINVEEFYKMNSSKVICDDQDDFLEKLKNEIERDMEQEKARMDRHYEESVKEKQKEGKCSNVLSELQYCSKKLGSVRF